MTLPTQHLSCGRVARDEPRQASNQNGYQKGHESSKSIVQYVSDGVHPSKYKKSYCADVQSKVLTQNGAPSVLGVNSRVVPDTKSPKQPIVKS